MESQFLTAHLDLIQQLLNCPRGEEWNLLRENEALVDAELIDVMEQLAHYFTDEGQNHGATYLTHWIDELHRIIIFVTRKPQPQVTIQTYADLIQALLNYPKEKQDVILQENIALMHPQLAKMMRQVASQFYRTNSLDTADFLNTLATKVNRAWVKLYKFQPNLKKANQLVSKPLDSGPPLVSTPKIVPTISTQPPTEITTGQSSSMKPSVPSDTNVGVQLTALEKTVGSLGKEVQAIVASLNKIEETLSRYLKSANPLEYQTVLEQAATAEWIISSTEAEQLIGVKPYCNKGEVAYQRGNWQFVKVGKIGTQTGWRVEKVADNS